MGGFAMSDSAKRERYSVNVHGLADEPGTFPYTFVPLGRGRNGSTQPAPQYIVDVKVQNDQVAFHWRGSAPEREGATQRDFEEEVRVRLIERKDWIDRVTNLVAGVEQWAKELGWSTRQVLKPLDDARIGK